MWCRSLRLVPKFQVSLHYVGPGSNKIEWTPQAQLQPHRSCSWKALPSSAVMRFVGTMTSAAALWRYVAGNSEARTGNGRSGESGFRVATPARDRGAVREPEHSPTGVGGHDAEAGYCLAGDREPQGADYSLAGEVGRPMLWTKYDVTTPAILRQLGSLPFLQQTLLGYFNGTMTFKLVSCCSVSCQNSLLWVVKTALILVSLWTGSSRFTPFPLSYRFLSYVQVTFSSKVIGCKVCLERFQFFLSLKLAGARSRPTPFWEDINMVANHGRSFANVVSNCT